MYSLLSFPHFLPHLTRPEGSKNRPQSPYGEQGCIFTGSDNVDIQELGPRFTLRLKALYRGTFAECDRATGSGMEVEYMRKKEKNRRDFAL